MNMNMYIKILSCINIIFYTWLVKKYIYINIKRIFQPHKLKKKSSRISLPNPDYPSLLFFLLASLPSSLHTSRQLHQLHPSATFSPPNFNILSTITCSWYLLHALSAALSNQSQLLASPVLLWPKIHGPLFFHLVRQLPCCCLLTSWLVTNG